MTVVVPQQTRPAGTYATTPADEVVPPTDATRLTISMPMSQANVANAANQADILIESTEDETGATGWHLEYGGAWIGGQLDRNGVARPCAVTIARTDGSGRPTPLPRRLRGQVTTNRQWSWGLDLTTA